jgi:hypothetical protein
MDTVGEIPSGGRGPEPGQDRGRCEGGPQVTDDRDELAKGPPGGPYDFARRLGRRSRRTTTHAQSAQAFVNVTRRTRLSFSAVHTWSGLVDGSWRATSPSCRTSPGHLCCAKPDGGCAKVARRCEGVARTSHSALVAPSRDTRSVFDPPGYGPASRPTLSPGTVPTPDHRGWLHSESSPTEGL